MYFEITEAKYVADHKLYLCFEDGSKGTVDFGKFIEKGTVFAKLSNMSTFKNFEIQYGTIVWKSEDVDIAPETLYAEATGKEITYTQQSSVVP
jgi:hypothetical protein